MKYSNLSNKEKIFLWFSKNPSNINLKCENNTHILDWVCDGYRGSNISKIEVINHLIYLGAKTEDIKQKTFNFIAEEFIKLKKQLGNSPFVLNELISNKKSLEKFKEQISPIKVYCNDYVNNTHMELKSKIIFENIPLIVIKKSIIELCSLSDTNKNKFFFYDNLFNILRNSEINTNLEHTNSNISFLDLIIQSCPKIELCERNLKKIISLENYKSLSNRLSNENNKSNLNISKI